MNFEIQKIPSLSGRKASIYTIYDATEGETLLDRFIRENETDFPDEVENIVMQLRSIATKTGVRAEHIKSGEGKWGDGVVALFDNPGSNLRLYCVQMSKVTLIVGGGGHKPKTIRSLQENPQLTQINYFMRKISQLIDRKIKEKEIRYDKNGMDLIGELYFEETDLQH